MNRIGLQKQRDNIIIGKMKRSERHKSLINRIAKDDRLSPHRRLLAELFLVWIDCVDPQEKKDVFDIIKAQYGTARRTSWLPGDDPDLLKPKIGKIEAEATQALKDFFSKVEEEVQEAKDEVSTEIL